MCPDVEASFCFPQKYRNPNGECNNVKHPMWGVTGAAYLRLQEPQYEDGVRTPRNMARSGRTKLPDALTVSSKLIWTRNNPHEHLTSLAAIWGQFVSHDISYTLPLSGYEKVMNYLNFLSPSKCIEKSYKLFDSLPTSFFGIHSVVTQCSEKKMQWNVIRLLKTEMKRYAKNMLGRQ